MYHTGPGAADGGGGPEALDPFVKISPQFEQLNTLRALTLVDAAGEQAAQSSDGVRCAYMNTAARADPPTLQAAAEAYLAAIETLKGCEGITCSLTLQPYPASLLRRGGEPGGRERAWAQRRAREVIR